MSLNERPLLAVLIDADNIPAKHAEAILNEITALGEPALRRVYGDWKSPQLGDWSGKARDLGLVTHQESANTKGKNASDIGMVIDAMDILHTGRFDGFVLVSSDSDFTRLASRIREQGLVVYGIGEAKTPNSVRAVCNRFILIENIVEDPAPGDKGAAPAGSGKQSPAQAVPLILRAMDKLEQDDEWYSLAALGKALIAETPDFDTRTYGHKKLKDLMSALKRFEMRSTGNHIQVRRRD
ncbi:NYN domain-containing protein [Actibacterium sp. XHP0104]|uniref:NYN domain-containing protein n=1 Tax=Actibacterium sp. XHP0104 TaxID=2984335 RepID=UPI0021E98002|nr:NYN domain-containing protein [Actibacterium sp. XHP0104]MCV2881680.1 NYN domain-containing protein [Actibacterium sp. XHP0104]